MNIELIIQSASYLGIFGLMIANGFASFPSSQVLYIIVGYFVGTGALSLFPASLIGALGNTIGNIALYEAVRRHGIHYVEKFQLFPLRDIKKIQIVFRKRGTWFLFVGKLLPAIKVFVPIFAGIGRVHRGIFATFMFTASWIWSLAFIAIGYFFGKSAGVWKSYSILLVVVAFIVLLIFYRMLNAKEVLRELEQHD